MIDEDAYLYAIIDTLREELDHKRLVANASAVEKRVLLRNLHIHLANKVNMSMNRCDDINNVSRVLPTTTKRTPNPTISTLPTTIASYSSVARSSLNQSQPHESSSTSEYSVHSSSGRSQLTIPLSTNSSTMNSNTSDAGAGSSSSSQLNTVPKTLSLALRKSGCDIIRPKVAQDFVLLCIFLIMHMKDEDFGPRKSRSHRTIIETIIHVMESEAARKYTTEFSTISKTKIRGLLGVLKHADVLLAVTIEPVPDVAESNISNDQSASSLCHLFLNEEIDSFEGMKCAVDQFFLNYGTENDLEMNIEEQVAMNLAASNEATCHQFSFASGQVISSIKLERKLSKEIKRYVHEKADAWDLESLTTISVSDSSTVQSNSSSLIRSKFFGTSTEDDLCQSKSQQRGRTPLPNIVTDSNASFGTQQQQQSSSDVVSPITCASNITSYDEWSMDIESRLQKLQVPSISNVVGVDDDDDDDEKVTDDQKIKDLSSIMDFAVLLGRKS
jgi:hypothetical protein